MDPVTVMAGIQAANLAINLGREWMEERRRKKELTPEQEAAWDAYVAAQTAKPHWQPSRPQAG